LRSRKSGVATGTSIEFAYQILLNELRALYYPPLAGQSNYGLVFTGAALDWRDTADELQAPTRMACFSILTVKERPRGSLPRGKGCVLYAGAFAWQAKSGLFLHR
jgi:hypothetical protein